MKITQWLALAFLFTGSFFVSTPGRADTYIPPTDARTDTRLDSGWRFIRQDVAGAESPAFDDAKWSVITLPHTWNNFDGEDGGSNYYRGTGMYRTHFTLDAGQKDRHLFLKFDGASLVAEVWLNGTHLGRHEGGFADFVYDITPYVQADGDNVLAVKVSNAVNTNVPPLSADFTFFGGLYRPVHLLAVDPVHISPLDYGSPGVYLQTTEVGADSAKLRVTSLVSNSTPAAVAVTVRSVVVDAENQVVATLTNMVTLPPSTLSNVVAATTIANPHLWNGLSDSYLYHCYVEVWSGGKIVDVVKQPLGFRFCRWDPDQGFFLNGHYYDLHGASQHQDWQDRGWAIGDAERRENFAIIKELGATAMRLSHYEHAEQTYDLADENGVVLWTEIPLINNITEAPAFYDNAKQQLKELIRQRYNHPSVVCWGIFNEITLRKGPSPDRLVSELAQLEAQEDPTRPSTCAVAGKDEQPSSWFSQINAFNKYNGWYGTSMKDFAVWADKVHADYPTNCIGISEYGAGASISQHSEDPVKQPKPTGAFHPEEYQNLFHETYWQEMKQRPFLWCKFIWCLTDFAVDSRHEGDAAGRNDKGLVTYDRQVRKDAFYWYKANWTTNPMVYITGHTFMQRQTNAVTAKVYANCGPVELFVNGVSQGVRESTNCIYTWPVMLPADENKVRAVSVNHPDVTDSLKWLAPRM